MLLKAPIYNFFCLVVYRILEYSNIRNVHSSSKKIFSEKSWNGTLNTRNTELLMKFHSLALKVNLIYIMWKFNSGWCALKSFRKHLFILLSLFALKFAAFCYGISTNSTETLKNCRKNNDGKICWKNLSIWHRWRTLSSFIKFFKWTPRGA